MKVGQAKSDSEESTAQVEKAISEVKAIMDELNSLRDINLDELDVLGKYKFFEISKMNLYFFSFLKWRILRFSCCLFYVIENRLSAAEAEVNRANLTDRLADLDRVKNEQNLSIKSYQNEVTQLEAEVRNIKLISEALPDGCFKQPRLEP